MADELYSAEIRVALKGQAAILASLRQVQAELQGVAASTAEFDAGLNKADRALNKATASATRSIGAMEKLGQAELKAGASAQKAAAGHRALHQSLSTTRYALYDASRNLTSFGLGLLAIPIASAVVAAKYQRDFATVERATLVTGKQAMALKAQLIDLSQTIPVGFKEITDIAGQGAQLGVKPAGLVAFTKVVAQLEATTNLTADAAGTLLGKFSAIGGVPAKDFGRLASAVLNVGVNTAATESQIAKTATQIVGIGKEAGFTTPQIVGLAGALASVSATGPELSRGTVTRFITRMQKAVDSGGTALTAFAKTAGVSTDKVQDAFGTPKFAGVFQKFIKGLNDIQSSGGNAVSVLNDMGITSVRDVPLLLNLANGHKVLAEALKDAAIGYKNQDILAVHYAKINDTLISRVKELGNTILSTFNDMGSSSTGPLYALTLQVTDMVKAFGNFAKTDFGGSLVSLGLQASVAFGALALLGGGITRIAGGAVAVKQAIMGLSESYGKFKVAQAAAAAATVSGQTKLGAFASFLTGPWGLALAAAAVGVIALTSYLNSLKTPAAELENSFASTGTSYKKLSKEISAGQSVVGSNPFGKSLDDSLKNLDGSLADSAKRWKDYWAFGVGGAKNTQVSQFNNAMNEAGQRLASLAQKDLPSAQNGFLQLASHTNLSATSLWRLLSVMAPYKEELIKQATAAGVSATKTELLKLALGSTNENFLKSAGSAKAYIDKVNQAADASKKFSQGLLDASGQANAKDFGKFLNDQVGAYQKSIQPLLDMNSVIAQVQTSLKAANKDYDGSTVSLDQYTDALAGNANSAEAWLQNIKKVGQTYGTDVANQFIQAGYSVTNASILQQLIDATPAQAAAYIAANTAAINASSQAAGDALIASVGLTQGGKQIGAETAKQIGAELLAGFSPESIMQQFNLEFANNPAKPQADTTEAKDAINALTPYASNQHPEVSISGANKPALGSIDEITPYALGQHPHVNLYSNVDPAQQEINNLIARNDGRRINIFVATNTGGSVLPGQQMQPQGATGGFFTGTGFRYSIGGPVFGAGSGTSDDVPAWLSNGEFVIKASSVQAIGLGNLMAMNHYGKLPQYRAAGGPVSSRPFAAASPRIVVQTPSATRPGVQIVELSRYDRQLLTTIADNVGVEISQNALVSATGAANVNSTNRRTN